MKKVYFLSSCDTCREIMKKSGGMSDFVKQDIKNEPVTSRQLEELKTLAGTYEALFSRKAIKYREMGLKDKVLTEADYKALILKEYTFLKRPVVILGKNVFIGNEKKTVEALVEAIQSK